MSILNYKRMPIEIEAPEQFGYDKIKYNLAESSVYDFNFSSFNFNLKDLKLAYCDHLGKIELRELLTQNTSNLKPQHVLLTNGAAGALFIVATSLLGKKDHAIIVSPNYSNNIETPQLIGCEITTINLRFEEKFKLNIQEIARAIKPNTELISLTTPHNPTGVVLEKKEINQLIELAKKHQLKLLFDETYKGLTPFDNFPFLADLDTCIISVSSLSKTYGLPGIRLGWLMTQDKQLNELFLAAKEQIYITNSILDEEIAYQFLLNKAPIFAKIKEHVATNFTVVKEWINTNKYINWVEPQGGVVCFPKIEATIDIELFYQLLNHELKTWVGPGHWFDRAKTFFRLGYGWPSTPELKGGLQNIDLAIKKSMEVTNG